MATSEEEAEIYDIVIVGGGTAGCVLGNRLSEDPGISVLLLEAGEDRNNDERVYTPGLSAKIVDNPDFDWQYVTELQSAINGTKINHPRGKLLGGSSAINSYALVYPSQAGLDAWAELGNEGWDWQTMKPYYAKFQTLVKPDKKIAEELGIVQSDATTNGPVQASYPCTAPPLLKDWIKTFEGLSLVNRNDELDGTAIGAFSPSAHISQGKHERCHAGVAYYEPVRERPNLKLLTGVLAERIHFEPAADGHFVATGVSYIQSGLRKHIRARKEVLLAAGAFATPQLLELSGIGDRDLLRQHGIALVHHNSSVGENLQDHIRAGISFEPAVERETLKNTEARRLYEQERKGPWTEAPMSFAYLPLDQFASPSEKAALSEMFSVVANDPSTTAFERKRNDFIKAMALSSSEATAVAFPTVKPPPSEPDGKKWITLIAMLSHPLSRGSVHITSPDVSVRPGVDFRYFSHPLDFEILARHLQTLETIAAKPPLADHFKRDGARYPVGLDARTLDGAKEIIKGYPSTNYHPCGTCSMMPEEMGGVVDSRLRVYGTKNVRVVDASMIPIIPRGNIITTVYAVAERAADIISSELGMKRVT